MLKGSNDITYYMVITMEAPGDAVKITPAGIRRGMRDILPISLYGVPLGIAFAVSVSNGE